MTEETVPPSMKSAVPPSTGKVPEVFRRGTLRLVDWPEELDDRTDLEAAVLIPRRMPRFRLNLSGKAIEEWLHPLFDVHGSGIVRRSNVLVLGANIQVDEQGHWACESRAFKQQFLDMCLNPTFQVMFPGKRPDIRIDDTGNRLVFDSLSEDAIEVIEEPLFLATPLEPTNWGRWVITVIPKIWQFRRYGQERRFFCHSSLPWQKNLLNRFGVSDIANISHNPGNVYFCKDVMTVDYNVANLTISKIEHSIFAEIRDDCVRRYTFDGGRQNKFDRIFVSRLTYSAKHPHYRVLQNERELAQKLQILGFSLIEPELLDFDTQVGIFGTAKVIVCLGGAALFNAVFCRSDARVVTIESGTAFLLAHCTFLSSLHLDFGVIIGQQDATDPTLIHKRWSVDVEAVFEQVKKFIE